MFLFGGKEVKEKQSRPRFKDINDLHQRINLRMKFQQKYPKDRYALLVLQGLDQFQPQQKSFHILGVENHFTILMLLEYIRLKIFKSSDKVSFFLKIRNQIRRTTDNLGQLFRKYQEEDGFLYIQIKRENVF